MWVKLNLKLKYDDKFIFLYYIIMETTITNLSTKELKYSIFRILEPLNDWTERRLLIIDEKDFDNEIWKQLRENLYNSFYFFNNNEKLFRLQKHYLINTSKDEKIKINNFYAHYLNLGDWIRDYWEQNNSNSITSDKCDLYVFIEK